MARHQYPEAAKTAIIVASEEQINGTYFNTRLLSVKFDIHVTVHLVKFLVIKPTRCMNFLKFILGVKLYMFQTISLSVIRSFSLYTQ